MKKFILETEDRESITKLYESKGLILNEQFAQLIRKARSWVGKNEDDIATLFKTSERTLAVTIDDVVSEAVKSKSVTPCENLQIQLMNALNPSGLEANMAAAKNEVKNLLNGYAKSKGINNWTEIKNSVSSGGPKPNAGQPAGASTAAASSVNQFVGKRVSNNSWRPEHIDFSKMTTVKNIDELNKAIAQALKTGNWNYIPRAGFDKLGVKATDFNGEGFRGFIKDQLLTKGAKINEVIPETGRWSVTFV